MTQYIKILEKKKKESLHCLLHKANLVIWNAVYDVSISTVLASRMKELPFNFQKMEGKKKKNSFHTRMEPNK